MEESKNGRMKSIVKRTVIIIMALVCTGAVFYMLWLGGAFLPRWVTWDRETLYDASGRYEIILERKKVKVVYDSNVIWDSPDEVRVQQVMSCDIDNDQNDELILLCWKIGRFGESRPFWVEEDEKKWSQHIFVYRYDQGTIKPKWGSSYIGQEVVKMTVYDENTDRMPLYENTVDDQMTADENATDKFTAAGLKSDKEEAAGRNKQSTSRIHLLLTAPDEKTSCWIWDSWGFTKEDREASFVVFGDILTHEPIYRYGLNHDENFDFLFENMQDVIVESDIAVINQETPLTDNPAMYGDYPRFGTPDGVGEAVADAGFDVVTCATNHLLDRGAEGVDFTKKFFDTHEIRCLGIQSKEEKNYCPYSVLVKNGIRFAMLNYTYGTNGIRIPEDYPNMIHLLDDEEKIRRDIAVAQSESDCVIVFAHWGTEYEELPDDFQKAWTQVFLESGVDVVVGTHPHALQPYEVLHDEESGHEMLVYYSIGNYVSAQHEQSCVKGGMAKFTVSLTPEGYRVTEYMLEPLTIVRQEDGRYTVE